MPAQWFAVRSQGLDCQGGTGGEENLHIVGYNDHDCDGDDHDFRDGQNECDHEAGHDGGDGGNGDDFADDYVNNSGGGDDTWVESGAQARA